MLIEPLGEILFFLLLHLILTLPLGLGALRFLGFSIFPLGPLPFFLGLTLGQLLIGPLLYLFCHLVPLQFFPALFISFGAALLLWLLSHPSQKTFPSSSWRKKEILVLGALAIWLLFQLSVQFWQPHGEAHYYSIVYDFIKHDGIIFSLAGNKLPATNPFFVPGEPVRLSYYFIFHLLPACLAGLTSGSYHHLFAASVVFTAISCLGVFYLWVKEKTSSVETALTTTSLLVFFGGFDFLVSFQAIREIFQSCTETLWSCWWAKGLNLEYRFGGFTNSNAYAPHNGLSIAGFFASALLYKVAPKRNMLWFFLPLMGLSLVGSSVYLGIFAFLLLLALVTPNAKKCLKQIQNPAALFSLSATIILFSLFAWEIRPYPSALNAGIRLDPLVLEPQLSLSLLNRLFVLLRYLFVFFPFLLIFLLDRGQIWRKSYAWEKLVVVGGLSFALLFASQGPHNDFSLRLAVLVRCVATSMAGVALVQLWHQKKRRSLIIIFPFVLLGILSNLNHMGYWGLVRIQEQAVPTEGTRDYLEMATFIKEKTPSTAEIQGPVRDMSHLLMYTRRRSAVLDQVHGSLLNVNQKEWQASLALVHTSLTQWDTPEGVIASQKLGINYLILNRSERMAQPAHGLVKVFENRSFEVFQVPTSSRLKFRLPNPERY